MIRKSGTGDEENADSLKPFVPLLWPFMLDLIQRTRQRSRNDTAEKNVLVVW